MLQKRGVLRCGCRDVSRESSSETDMAGCVDSERYRMSTMRDWQVSWYTAERGAGGLRSRIATGLLREGGCAYIGFAEASAFEGLRDSRRLRCMYVDVAVPSDRPDKVTCMDGRGVSHHTWR